MQISYPASGQYDDFRFTEKKHFSLSAREVKVGEPDYFFTIDRFDTRGCKTHIRVTLTELRWSRNSFSFHRFRKSCQTTEVWHTRKWCFHISLNKCVMSDLFSEANVMYVQKTWNAFRPFMSSHHLHTWSFGQFWFKIGFSALIEALPVWNKLVFFSGNVSFIHEIIPQVKLGSCRGGGQVEVRFPASSTIFQRSLLRGWTKALAKRHVSGG